MVRIDWIVNLLNYHMISCALLSHLMDHSASRFLLHSFLGREFFLSRRQGFGTEGCCMCTVFKALWAALIGVTVANRITLTSESTWPSNFNIITKQTGQLHRTVPKSCPWLYHSKNLSKICITSTESPGSIPWRLSKG